MDEDTATRLTGLFERHYDEVLAYCARRIGRSEAEDVAAEVFAVASRRADEIEWETARPWLFGIARRVMANRFRSIHRRQLLGRKVAGLAEAPLDSPDEVVIRDAEAREALATLRLLRPADREILMLAAWEELTAAQIAHSLGISVAATEKRLERAKRRFARNLHPVANAVGTPNLTAEGGGSP